MLDQLRHARDVISMEAVSGGTAEDKAAARLPTFLDKASEFLTKTIFQKIGDFFSIKNLGWLAQHAQRKPFSEVRGVQVVAPQGFKGSLVDYGNALIKAVEDTQDFEANVLSPFASWLGQRLADPDSLRSVSNSLKIPGLQHIKVDQLSKSLDAFFPNKTDAEAPVYGDLFRRQGDWTDLSNQVKKLNAYYTNGKFEKIQAKVPEISQLLTVFAQRAAQYPEEFQFSSVTTEQLGKVTFEIAEQVEFYGVLRHRVEEFCKIVNDNVEIIKDHV